MTNLLASSVPHDEPGPVLVEIARQIEPWSDAGEAIALEGDARRCRLRLTGSIPRLPPTVCGLAIVEAMQRSSSFSLPTAADIGRRALSRSPTVRPDDRGHVRSTVSDEQPNHPLLSVGRVRRCYAALRIGLLALILGGCSSEGPSNTAKDGKEIMSDSEFKEIAKTAKNQRSFNKILQKKLMEDTGTVVTTPHTKGKRRP